MFRFKILFTVSWIALSKSNCQSSANSTSVDSPPNYESLTKDASLFVDKTMLLYILFDSCAEGEIISITTPPGFGRTTNLQMIKNFASMPVSSRGNIADTFNSTNKRVFSLNSKPILAVSRLGHMIRDHLTKYPVVYLDLGNVTAPSLRQTMRNLHNRVKQSYADHDWLEGKKLRRTEYAHRDILRRDKYRKEWQFIKNLMGNKPNAVDVQTSISKLIGFLADEFNRKIILLIDNYDSPIMDAVYHRSNTTVDQFYEFFNVFFSNTLDDIANLTKLVLLTGTYPVPIRIRTEITFYRFQDQHHFSEYFGYTELEVQHLSTLNSGSHPVQELRNNFGGFLANGSQTLLYNTKSLTTYFKSTRAPNSTLSLAQLPSLYDPRIHKLVRKFMPNVTWQQDKGAGGYWDQRSFEILPYLEVDRLERISRIVNDQENITGSDMDTYFSILFANGYFTHPNGSAPDVIAFPNFQMLTTFQKYLN